MVSIFAGVVLGIALVAMIPAAEAVSTEFQKGEILLKYNHE